MNKKLLLLFILLSCLFIKNVNAENGYTTDKTGISLRNYPSTSSTVSTVLKTIPYNVDFYISNTNAAPAGNGCKTVWYYAYYEETYGYVCSNIVNIVGVTNTSYNRPWTTPKAAIVGGAIFIGEGYISKGQFTSYLKKFNVNPKGTYSLYNHQYMANLRAPAGESLTTYNSLSKNNSLDSAYNFSIPVYTDIDKSEQKYSYAGLYSGYDLPTTTDTDDAFEQMISTFPETYKPYLRAIHKLPSHSSWTFIPMITGITLDDALVHEKGVSSIDDSKYCDPNGAETESGWCEATDDATKYFLDVRNFLNEKYVFMFQDLSYSDIVTESIVQSVLNNTFMSGISALDNQSYASIFIEAGKNVSAKVSPLYLASLSLQEVGSNGSVSTTGDPFTYENYDYKGLYNFFNIGASSSESNPVLAGLVYANGGRGTNSTPVTPPDNTTVSNDFIGMLSVSKVGEYIKGYNIGTTVSAIKNTVGTNATVTIKDENGNVKADSGLIGTGCQINIKNSAGEQTYTYVLYGDLTGDGEINSADLLRLRLHLLGINTLSGSFSTSANVTNDSEINSADLLKIRKYLLGTEEISES